MPRQYGEAGATPAPVGTAVPPPASDVPSVISPDLPSTLAPDARFRDRRLLILYFDRMSLANDFDRQRAFEGALGFVTMDGNLEHQQNVTVLPFGIVVVEAPSNRVQDLAPLVPEMLAHCGAPSTAVGSGTRGRMGYAGLASDTDPII